jgi:hypothetical protein
MQLNSIFIQDGQHSFLATGSVDATICIHYIGDKNESNIQGMQQLSHCNHSNIGLIDCVSRYSGAGIELCSAISRSLGRNH